MGLVTCNRRRRLLGILVAAVALGGCGPVERRAPSAAGKAALPAALDPASLAAADLARGEVLALACRACHSFEAGADHLIGPNLFGIFGGAAAARDGFAYSAPLRASGIVWSPEVLDRWLVDPAGFVNGSSMTFAGYADPVDRRDLIAYLLATLEPTERVR